MPAKRNNLKQHKVCITLNVRSWLTYTTSLHQGRWPEKSVKFITRLLKNAESNADAKNLDVEDLIIKNIVVQQAPVGLPFDSSSPTLIFTCLNNRKLAAVRTVLMVASTPTKVTLAMSKLSSRYLRRRWNEARIRRSQLLHLLALIGDRSQSAALKLHAPEDGGSCVCMYASLCLLYCAFAGRRSSQTELFHGLCELDCIRLVEPSAVGCQYYQKHQPCISLYSKNNSTTQKGDFEDITF